MLKAEIDELIESGYGMDLIGFDSNDLEKLVNEQSFEPGNEDDQGKLDQLDPKWVSCPHCGKEFDARQG
jgi:spermidine/putrescine-binding protein